MVHDILTREEHLAAMQLGVIHKLASLGISPSQFVEIEKQAQAKGNGLIKDLMMLSVGLGIPLGVAWYSLFSHLKPSNTNKEEKKKLDAYNDIVDQYKDIAKKNKEKDLDFNIEVEQNKNMAINTDDYLSSEYEKLAAHPIIDGAGAGIIAGGTIASLQALISAYAEAKRQKKKQSHRDSDSISEDTIILYVNPDKKKNKSSNKYASDTTSGKDKRDKCIPVKIKAELANKLFKYKNYSQPRSSDGKFTKKAQIREGATKGVWLASLLASIPLGYVGAKKVVDLLEKRRLEDQIEAAQKEYIDILSGSSKTKKTAEFLEYIGINTPEPIHKQANGLDIINNVLIRPIARGIDKSVGPGTPGGSLFENITAVGVAAAILSTLSAGYITNKVLHKNFDEPKGEEDINPIKRVIFKQGSYEEEITCEQALATILVLRECIKTASNAPLTKKAGLNDAVEAVKAYIQGTENYTLGQLNNIYESMKNGGKIQLPKAFIEQLNDPNAVAGLKQIIASNPKFQESINNIVQSQIDNMKKNMQSGNSAGLQPDPNLLKLMQAMPEYWVNQLGQQQNKDFIKLMIDSQLKQQNGLMGTLSNIPILGDIIRYFTKAYYTNTQSGRRALFNRTLGTYGIPQNQINELTKNYDFSGKNGLWARQQPTAQVPAQGAQVGAGGEAQAQLSAEEQARAQAEAQARAQAAAKEQAQNSLAGRQSEIIAERTRKNMPNSLDPYRHFQLDFYGDDTPAPTPGIGKNASAADIIELLANSKILSDDSGTSEATKPKKMEYDYIEPQHDVVISDGLLRSLSKRQKKQLMMVLSNVNNINTNLGD